MIAPTLTIHALISLAYLAGFVDGEGYVALARICRGGRSPEYCARLVVYNTNREILSQIQRSWGGTLAEVEGRRPGWKSGCALIWTNAAAAALLKDLAPYLLIKAPQAEALLRFQAHVRSSPRRRKQDGSLSTLARAERMSREALFRQMKELNTRDPAVRRLRKDRPWRPGGSAISPRYLAGFVDGEGSLMIVRSRSRTDGRTQYRARIAVANTDRRLLEEIRRVYGGILVALGGRATGWNPGYQLVWTEGRVPHVLALVAPHLRIKQGQASLLSDFLDHMQKIQQGRNGKSFASLPDDVKTLRDEYHLRMANLNARGTSDSRNNLRDAA